MNVDLDLDEAQWGEWINRQVVKKSGKPFKSGEKTATVKSLAINPYTERAAFIFLEDDSVVDCRATKLKEMTCK